MIEIAELMLEKIWIRKKSTGEWKIDQQSCHFEDKQEEKLHSHSLINIKGYQRRVQKEGDPLSRE